MRVAPGGVSTICLGVLEDDGPSLNEESSNKFASGSNQNAGNCITNRPSTRLHQAPGGNSTICLGDDSVDSNTSDRSSRPRPSPGGPTTISLTYDETPSKSRLSDNYLAPEPEAAGVFFGPANGAATICFGVTAKDSGGKVEKLEPTFRQPPGGNTTICLGYDPQINETPRKLQWPGGSATVCLGVDDDNVVVDVPPSGRKAPGGEATISFGACESAEAGKNVRQTPGGNSTICFGASEEMKPTLSYKFICGPGGPSSICFGATDDPVMPDGNSIPPGGKTTICLGVDESGAEDGNHVLVEPTRPVGGATTICLGVLDDVPPKFEDSGRVAPGGATTICLGLSELPPRLPSNRQAPGGNTTICLGEDFGDENINTANSVAYQPDATLKPSKILGEQSTTDANCICLA